MHANGGGGGVISPTHPNFLETFVKFNFKKKEIRDGPLDIWGGGGGVGLGKNQKKI